MKLLVKKVGVDYGVNGSNVAITDMADIATLQEGTFLIAFDNGVVIVAAGTFTGVAGEKAIIYHKLNGELNVSSPIYVGKSKINHPLVDHAAAAKIATFSIVKPATIETDDHTGLSFVDNTKNVMDSTRRSDVTVYTDEDTIQGDLDALQAKVLALDFVATCALATNTLTITYIAGANISVTGLGLFEKTVATVTTPLSYGDSLSYEEMMEFAQSVSCFDGNTDTDIDGTMDFFTRKYGIVDDTYLIYGIEVNNSVYATGKSDISQYGAVLYVAVAEDDVAATGELFIDILNAAVTGISADTTA